MGITKLTRAMKKAVELGVFPKIAFQDERLKYRETLRQILEAAESAATEAEANPINKPNYDDLSRTLSSGFYRPELKKGRAESDWNLISQRGHIKRALDEAFEQGKQAGLLQVPEAGANPETGSGRSAARIDPILQIIAKIWHSEPEFQQGRARESNE